MNRDREDQIKATIVAVHFIGQKGSRELLDSRPPNGVKLTLLGNMVQQKQLFCLC
jgi:hypothetical protein